MVTQPLVQSIGMNVFTFLSCRLAGKSQDERLCCEIYLASVLSGSESPRVGLIGLLCHLGCCLGFGDVPWFFAPLQCWLSDLLLSVLCLIVRFCLVYIKGPSPPFFLLLWRRAHHFHKSRYHHCLTLTFLLLFIKSIQYGCSR